MAQETNGQYDRGLFPPGFEDKLQAFKVACARRFKELREAGLIGPDAKDIPQDERSRLLDEYGLTGILARGRTSDE